MGKVAQTLQMEPAWEKTVSKQDRELIQETFNSLDRSSQKGFTYTYLRHDFNHRNALLVIVLVHNYEEVKLKFVDQQVQCCSSNGNQLASKTFTVPIDIPANTSMPWTFIFPIGCYHAKAQTEEVLVVTSSSRENGCMTK